ncbi:chitin synthase-domain-containing protein [Endogone sp. FLAS-F59071]|nr:chitin synthase-domain-containing protein [Endogone sp. FLAS-F59071]|eukprot:RUS17593.1 chitin synthase-domain-containing protein [Endogone sp. FLAS-F59071]
MSYPREHYPDGQRHSVEQRREELNPIAAVFDAVRQKDVQYLRAVLDHNSFDANALWDREGRTPLMTAAAEGAIQIVGYLCGIPGINLDLKDSDGESAIHHAAATGWVEVVDLLMRAGASIETENKVGTPIFIFKQKLTPLVVAAYNGHSDVCARLLDVGHAEINHRDSTGKTAIILAAYEGHTACVDVLIQRGVDIDAQDQYGWTALMLAAYSGRMECSQLLVLNGADRFIRTANNKDAVQLAHDADYPAIADMIVNSGRVPTPALRPPRTPRSSTPDYGIRPLTPSGPSRSSPHMPGPHMSGSSMAGLSMPGSPMPGPPMPGPSMPRPPMPGPMPSFGERPLPPIPNFDVRPPRPPMPFGNIPMQNLRNRGMSGQAMPVHNPARGRDRLVPRNQQGHMPLNAPMPPTHRRTPLNPGHAKERLGDRRGPGDNVADLPPPEKYTTWKVFSIAITCCFPSACLRMLGKMDARSQQAWREKCALCLIILFISFILGFLTFGLSSLACQKIVPIYPEEVAAMYGANSTGAKVMIVRGQLYDVGSFFDFGFHRPILPYTDESLAPIVDQLYGQDISALFPANPNASGCPFTPLNGELSFACNKDGDPRFHCHTSKNANLILRSLNFGNLWIAFTWDNVTRGDGGRKLIAYNEQVFDVGGYLNLTSDQWYLGADDQDRADVYNWLNSSVGLDITLEVSHSASYKALIPCFEDQFLVGKIDGTTIGCFATNLIMIVETVVLMAITLIKFVSAVAFDWLFSRKLGKISRALKEDAKTSYVMLLVTCYSEGEDSMRTTLNSLAACKYSDRHKLLVVIADGNITGSGETQSTPEICKSLMQMQTRGEPEALSYIAIGAGSKAHNMAKVYCGWYNYLGHQVPMVLISKCGTPEEQATPKAGNRGKRDSQLILMQWLSKVTFDERMTPLEFELFEKVHGLAGVTPDKYNMVLMVDADTLVKRDSLGRMVAAMEQDPEIMGLCGETKIANKAQSFTTMIQVFEYYISHHLGKAFESIFGGVTCLPGCFCMYRVKAPKYGGYMVPILASPEIVEMYSSNVVETLHQKNLLLLGEDRFLTTLMLRTFPKRKMIYVPRAVCKTVVPDSFRVLLSQRRRWINSTIHNLMELILVPQLCGIFCCSMQFVVFLDLVGTVVLPAALLFLIFLIIMGTVFHQDVLFPLLFMAALFGMQAILILFTTRKVVYVLWMLVYIFAIPIWNFLLPLYAFWHFDDFSWGATRQIQGRDTGHGRENMEGTFDPFKIPMKKWQDWQEEKQQRRRKIRPPMPVKKI